MGGDFIALSAALLALGAGGLSVPVQAAENGNISWPIGVNTVLNGVATAPGENRLYNYTLFYSANRLNGGAGDDSGVDVDAKVFVNALRLDHGWGMIGRKTHLVSGFVLPYVDASITLFGDKSTDNGLGNLSLKPLIIGTHNDANTFFMQIAPLDLDLPSGSYDRDGAANAAVNYTSWQPNAGYSWFPAPGWEIGGTLSAAVNTENDDTNYQTGWLMHYEQVVAWSVTDKLQLGVQGFYFKQMADDEVDGHTYLDGYRTRGAALGPQIRYDFRPGVAVVAKYQKEFDSENKAEGERFWVQFTFPF
ncbi:Protein involved in meta-pathway of phenol degradation [Alloalcanivorax dieselolei B5]|uniref:Protein involved in meta-pathway of phenol degradation n=1 Tax=Alcanivorax dieselolei (strain DSM 16502 / CGMCC 1.3690 / MCCC 1A00001 / B-5) TaxID=930169 RepID=K0CBF8_ALCDB|nr:Protein involved in meta-pathway of phenol degradation [Alloalcanivorax dieselolei B5]